MDFNFNFKMKLIDEEQYMTWPQIFRDYTKGFIAEFLGTFMLVFFGCACVQSYTSFVEAGSFSPETKKATIWYTIIPLEQALCFGLVIGSIIQVFGPITLAHINPAVSLSFFILGINSLPKMFLFIIAQMLGAIAGMAVLKELLVISDRLTPETYVKTLVLRNTYCCTLIKRGLSLVRAFLWEFVLTSFLILLVCTVVDPRHSSKDSLPLKFGFCLFCLVLIGATLTGTSLNPARSLGPAIIGGIYDDHWVFWAAPLSASLVTTVFYHIVFLPVDGQDEFRQLRQFKQPNIQTE